MEDQNIQEFEWVSEEVEKLYNLASKVFSVILKSRFPYIKRIEINKKEFNDVFVEDRPNYLNDVTAKICADWMSKEYYGEKQQEKESKRGGLGSTMSDIWKDSLLLTGTRLLNKKQIYLKLELNKKSFCEGYLKHTIKD
jgi:hypothetical protein